MNIEQLLTAVNAQRLGISGWTHAQAYPEFRSALQWLIEQQTDRQNAALRWANVQDPIAQNLSALIHRILDDR